MGLRGQLPGAARYRGRHKMNEMIIAGAALVAAAVIAWVIRGAIARSAQNALQDKLADLDTLKAEHARTMAELREVAERRAAAEAIASRVAGLEATVAERTHELGARDAKLAELST